MFDTAKSLLFGGSDQLAVAHQRRRRITVKSVQAKNNHRALQSSNASDVYMSTRKARRHEQAFLSWKEMGTV
jgi:hypothetical protein